MIVEVAAAVIERPDGRFLLARRPAGKVYAGWWEFPGGKVDPGETADAALARELDEELGITVRTAYPWITRAHVYDHATVCLRFYRVTAWEGEPRPREGQLIHWQAGDEPMAEPMLPANAPVLAALSLPLVYGVTCASVIGETSMLERIERAVRGGLRLVQIREPDSVSSTFVERALDLCSRFGARVMTRAPTVGAQGVHLRADQLRAGHVTRAGLLGASCHDEEEVRLAVEAGVDLVVLGPVQPTPSHPGVGAMGWRRFSDLAQGRPVPVYAIGGLGLSDLSMARQAGAHGIAMIRGAWGLG